NLGLELPRQLDAYLRSALRTGVAVGGNQDVLEHVVSVPGPRPLPGPRSEAHLQHRLPVAVPKSSPRSDTTSERRIPQFVPVLDVRIFIQVERLNLHVDNYRLATGMFHQIVQAAFLLEGTNVPAQGRDAVTHLDADRKHSDRRVGTQFPFD